MSRSRREWLLRAVSELAVIVVGVLVALAVDRWIATLDSKEFEDASLARLEQNLLVDSTRLARQIAQRQRKLDWAGSFRAALAGDLPTEEDAGEFLLGLDRLGAWTPFGARRETWDELMSSRGLALLRDPEVRGRLGAYYAGMARMRVGDTDMDSQLTALEAKIQTILEPGRRLEIVRPDAGSPLASLGEVEVALDRVRGDRSLHSSIVRAEELNGVIMRQYVQALRGNAATLELVRGGAS